VPISSPTSRIGMKTKSMPFGNIEAPVNSISLALAAGATFVARGFSGEQKHLTELIKQGILHQGFSFLDVFSPCVTYNHDNTYQWFRPRVKKLEEDSAYDAADWTLAMEKSLLWGDEIPIGKFFLARGRAGVERRSSGASRPESASRCGPLLR
jgi:2-oxoglutarate ferredoxin oxidoreductase subunit beta